MSGYITDEPYQLRKAGFPYLSFSPMAAGIDFYGDNLFALQPLLAAQPEMVKAFREASLRGWQYAMSHPGEVIDWIVADHPGTAADGSLNPRGSS